MKKYHFLLLAAFCIAVSAKAVPGDTTWIQANNTEFTHYGSFDTTINFPAPGLPYRKIYMIFTLGKYMCPGYGTTTEYCGDWDYTVQNYLMTPSGDTLELGRLITPYANNAAPRTPWTWTQKYVYDVTDYAYLLHDNASMRVFYSGYSWGFFGDIKFAFIEGTPDRNVVEIKRLWNGSYGYGDTTHSDSFDINTHFTPDTETVPLGTVTTDLKFIVTGHGSDENQCCEFMSHNYQVMFNGTSIATQQIWRDNCGTNELYPQSGTWLLERANWCPGDMIYPRYNALPGLTPGSTYNVAIQFDPYASTGGGSYTTEASLIYYMGMNKILDASIDDIIAPTNDQNHFRENPSLGHPRIVVKNTGATPIDSVTFQYGVPGSAFQTYTWIGILNPLHDTEVDLAPLLKLDTLAGTSGLNNFIVEILSVNGTTDADQTNDTMRSQFISAPVWPSIFKIIMYTSNISDSSDASVAETSWFLYDMNNDIVRERTNLNFNQQYLDTLNLPVGYYKLAIVNTPYADGSYYGLNWWALAGAGYYPGFFKPEKLTGSIMSMNGYSNSGTYNNDFGQNFTQYFYVDSAASTAITNVTGSGLSIDAYPNPARSFVNVDIFGIPNINGKIEIIDMLGRVVSETPCSASTQQINVEQLVSGVYTIVFVNNNSSNKLTARLLIAK